MRSEKTVLSTLSASAPAEMSVRFGMIVYYLKKTISCGCVNKKNLIQPLDLKGKTNKYGCTAIKQLEKHSDSYFWLCKCSCGKEFVTLAKGFSRIKSCGCAQEKARKTNMKKASEVYLNGCVENTSVYSIKPKKMLKNNTSGVRGVTFDKASQKWKDQIVFKGRNYYLGRYINKEDSIKARKMAEEAMFGNFLKWFQDTYPDRWKKMKNTDSSENEIAISKTMEKGGETDSFDSTKK